MLNRDETIKLSLLKDNVVALKLICITVHHRNKSKEARMKNHEDSREEKDRVRNEIQDTLKKHMAAQK